MSWSYLEVLLGMLLTVSSHGYNPLRTVGLFVMVTRYQQVSVDGSYRWKH